MEKRILGRGGGRKTLDCPVKGALGWNGGRREEAKVPAGQLILGDNKVGKIKEKIGIWPSEGKEETKCK
jgi:hypothetical protein